MVRRGEEEIRNGEREKRNGKIYEHVKLRRIIKRLQKYLTRIALRKTSRISRWISSVVTKLISKCVFKEFIIKINELSHGDLMHIYRAKEVKGY